MKKIIYILAAFGAACLFTACGNNADAEFVENAIIELEARQKAIPSSFSEKERLEYYIEILKDVKSGSIATNEELGIPVLDAALMGAIMLNYPKHAEYFISKGANVNTTMFDGAAECICPEIMQLLIEKGAVVDLSGRNGRRLLDEMILFGGKSQKSKRVTAARSALRFALGGGSLKQADGKMKSEASLMEELEKTEAPRLREDALKCLSILIENGADVNGDSDGPTALYYAIRYENPEALKMLLDAGADLNKGDISLLDYANERGNQEIIDILLAAGTKDPS